jgi:phytoene dehydrogenase-like protein
MVISIRIELNSAARAALMRSVAGEGGFQSLLRGLQAKLTAEGVLVLTTADVERIARYVRSYGGGGFQGRLNAILEDLSKLASALEPMAA